MKYLNTFDEASNTFFTTHPNPAHSQAQIQYDVPNHYKNVRVQIFNSFGELQQTLKLDQPSGTINSKELNPGLYIISVVSENAFLGSQKVIVVQ